MRGNENMPTIYDAVIAAGAKPFGMWALNSLRMEKGYRAWKVICRAIIRCLREDLLVSSN